MQKIKSLQSELDIVNKNKRLFEKQREEVLELRELLFNKQALNDSQQKKIDML